MSKTLERILDRLVSEAEQKNSFKAEAAKRGRELDDARNDLSRLKRCEQTIDGQRKEIENMRASQTVATLKVKALYEAADALRKEVVAGGTKQRKAVVEKALALSEALNAAQGYCAVIPF